MDWVRVAACKAVAPATRQSQQAASKARRVTSNSRKVTDGVGDT